MPLAGYALGLTGWIPGPGLPIVAQSPLPRIAETSLVLTDSTVACTGSRESIIPHAQEVGAILLVVSKQLEPLDNDCI